MVHLPFNFLIFVHVLRSDLEIFLMVSIGYETNYVGLTKLDGHFHFKIALE
jgi:hypothetical protein